RLRISCAASSIMNSRLQIYATSRDLHSFPTRRSSDLTVSVDDPAPAEYAVFGERGARAVVSVSPENLAAVLTIARQYGLAAREIDRKSTRLNSSHDQISYAVFCLKKKKTHVAAFLFRA